MSTAENLNDVGLDIPLRLDDAASLCFPKGGMTARGLRREYQRGNLVIYRVAGKDYTTRREIDRMCELCRLEVKARDSGCAKQGETGEASSLIPPSGSSSMVDISKARTAASMIAGELSSTSRNTSLASTSIKRRKGNVIHLKSR